MSEAPFVLRPIRSRDDAAVAAIIRDVMTEHGCCGQGFAIHDPEVAAMSAAYRGPDSAYYVVARGEAVLGGAGYAPLAGAPPEDRIAELRKMYFLPAARGLGLADALLGLLLDEMRAQCFARCYLETTSWMDAAQRLYRRHGFVEHRSPLGVTGHHGCDRFFVLDL